MGALTGSNQTSTTKYNISSTIIAVENAVSSRRYGYTAYLNGGNNTSYASIVDNFIWDNNIFKWYADGSSGSTGHIQLNGDGTTYYYLGIG